MRVTFFRVAERKSPKKGRPYCLRPLRFATGQPGVLGHGVHRRTRCAPAALRSNNCGESVHEACVSFGTHATPRPARPRRIQKGTPGADIHTGHCFAALRSAPSRGRKRHALRKLGRAQRWPVWLSGCSAVHPLLAAPAAGRLRGGHGRRSAHASYSDSPWLSERRAQRKASSTAHPATAPPQVCPVAKRRGRGLGVAFSLVTFFWRSKRKLLARRATPGSRTQNGHAVAAAQKPRQAQPERMGREKTIKTIASSAFCISACSQKNLQIR